MVTNRAGRHSGAGLFRISALFDNVGQGILWGWLVSPLLLTCMGLGLSWKSSDLQQFLVTFH